LSFLCLPSLCTNRMSSIELFPAANLLFVNVSFQ
jgi:hypothetical protein